MNIRSPRYHREIPQRYRLEAAQTESGKIYFPPRAVYPGAEEAKTIKLADRGKVITFTVIHTPPAEYSDLSPYGIAIVELDDGARITAQIADVEDTSKIEIGMRVKIEFRRMRTEGEEGLLCYGYKVVAE